jgi:hypothetical protein
MVKSFRRFHNWTFLFIAPLFLNFGATVAMEDNGNTNGSVQSSTSMQDQNVASLWKQLLDVIMELKKQLCISIESMQSAFTNKKCIQESSATLRNVINEIAQSNPKQAGYTQFTAFTTYLNSLAGEYLWDVGRESRKNIDTYKNSLNQCRFDGAYAALQEEYPITSDQMHNSLNLLKKTLKNFQKSYILPLEFEKKYDMTKFDDLKTTIRNLSGIIQDTYYLDFNGDSVITQDFKTKRIEQVKNIKDDIDIILTQYRPVLSRSLVNGLGEFKQKCETVLKDNTFWDRFKNKRKMTNFKREIESAKLFIFNDTILTAIEYYHPKIKVNTQPTPSSVESQESVQTTAATLNKGHSPAEHVGNEGTAGEEKKDNNVPADHVGEQSLEPDWREQHIIEEIDTSDDIEKTEINGRTFVDLGINDNDKPGNSVVRHSPITPISTNESPKKNTTMSNFKKPPTYNSDFRIQRLRIMDSNIKEEERKHRAILNYTNKVTDDGNSSCNPPSRFFKYALPAAICAGTACAAFAAYTYRNEIQTYLLPPSWQSAQSSSTQTPKRLLG